MYATELVYHAFCIYMTMLILPQGYAAPMFRSHHACTSMPFRFRPHLFANGYLVMILQLLSAVVFAKRYQGRRDTSTIEHHSHVCDRQNAVYRYQWQGNLLYTPISEILQPLHSHDTWSRFFKFLLCSHNSRPLCSRIRLYCI
jgi:hypothetical protein